MPRNDTRLMVRLPADVYDTLIMLSEHSERTLSAELTFLLRRLFVSAGTQWGAPEFVTAVQELLAALLPLVPPERKARGATVDDLLHHAGEALEKSAAGARRPTRRRGADHSNGEIPAPAV